MVIGDQLITLWNPVEQYFIWIPMKLKKLRILMDTIDTAPSINILQKVLLSIMVCCSDL